jgi:hypothetical protein
MGWDTAKAAADESGGGLFIKLADDKDSFIGVFLGEPETRRQVYNDKDSTYREFTDEDSKKGVKPRVSFSMNVYQLDVAKGAKGETAVKGELKIFGMNAATFKDLFTCKEKYGTDKWAFEVIRNGKKKDTKTTYSILPDHQISGVIAKQIAEIEKLHDLTNAKGDDAETDMDSHKKEKGEKSSAKTNGTAAPAAPATDSLIDEATKVQIIDRLKPHPQDKILALLKGLGIAKVRELKSSQLPDMLRALNALDGKTDAPAAAAEDPFG